MKKKESVPERWLKEYGGMTLEQCATRPNSLQMLSYPSVMGSKLHFPNGEVKDVLTRPDQKDC